MPKVTLEIEMNDADALRSTSRLLTTMANAVETAADDQGTVYTFSHGGIVRGKHASVEAEEEAETDVESPEPPVAGMVDTKLDAAGTPWDERIHAANQSQTKDGLWKRKRGVDQELYDSVMAEYGTPTPEPVDEAPTPQPTVDEAPIPTSAQEVPTPQPTVDEAPIPTSGMTYIDLFNAIQQAKIPADQVNGVLAQLGMRTLPQLVTTPEHIPTVAAALGLDG
jgi:cell division septation protein DedD